MKTQEQSSYRVLYGRTRTPAQDLIQLCRALNDLGIEDSCKVEIYDESGERTGTGIYARTVPMYSKCIASLVIEIEEDGAAIGLGERINARARAVVDYLELQTRLTWHLRYPAPEEQRGED